MNPSCEVGNGGFVKGFYYMVPSGVLIEGYNDIGDFVNDTREDVSTLSRMLNYDFVPVHEALIQRKHISMLEQAAGFAYGMRTKVLQESEFDRIKIGQGLRFLTEYLGHMVVTI